MKYCYHIPKRCKCKSHTTDLTEVECKHIGFGAVCVLDFLLWERCALRQLMNKIHLSGSVMYINIIWAPALIKEKKRKEKYTSGSDLKMSQLWQIISDSIVHSWSRSLLSFLNDGNHCFCCSFFTVMNCAVVGWCVLVSHCPNPAELVQVLWRLCCVLEGSSSHLHVSLIFITVCELLWYITHNIDEVAKCRTTAFPAFLINFHVPKFCGY